MKGVLGVVRGFYEAAGREWPIVKMVCGTLVLMLSLEMPHEHSGNKIYVSQVRNSFGFEI